MYSVDESGAYFSILYRRGNQQELLDELNALFAVEDVDATADPDGEYIIILAKGDTFRYRPGQLVKVRFPVTETP